MKDFYDEHADKIEALEQSFSAITDRLAEIVSDFDEWEEQAADL